MIAAALFFLVWLKSIEVMDADNAFALLMVWLFFATAVTLFVSAIFT